MTDWPILSVLIWLPIAVGVALLALGERAVIAGRWLALVGSLLTFALSLPLWTHFDVTAAAMQFAEHREWINVFNASYHLGLDGLAMPLVVLTTFITVCGAGGLDGH